MLAELSKRRGVLIATGGGVVLWPVNRKVLREHGLVVYMQTSVNQQLRRLGRDRSRPLLQTADRREKLSRLAEERNPLYQEVADIVFPAQNRALDAVASDLADIIREHGKEA